MDLTPLDIRKKRGDFPRGLRGYDPEEVDRFLEYAADRVEVLLRETLTLKERTERLAAQVEGLEGRERAVNEALVTAQELRREITDQAHREAESIRTEGEREARALLEEAQRTSRTLLEESQRESQALLAGAEREVNRLKDDAHRRVEEMEGKIEALERTRSRTLKAFRTLLERALDGVEAEEAPARTREGAQTPTHDTTGGTG